MSVSETIVSLSWLCVFSRTQTQAYTCMDTHTHTHTQINSSQEGPSFSVQDGYDSDARTGASIMCGCHVVVKDKTSRSANIKLVIASIIALVFMVGEVLGKLQHTSTVLMCSIMKWVFL